MISGAPASQGRVRERRRRSRDSGFTLIETLVALAVTAIAMMALVDAFTSGLRASRTAGQYAQAQIIARSVLAASSADRRGNVAFSEGVQGGFAWRLSVLPASDPGSIAVTDHPWRLHRLQIVVTWERSRELKLETLQLRKQL